MVLESTARCAMAGAVRDTVAAEENMRVNVPEEARQENVKAKRVVAGPVAELPQNEFWPGQANNRRC